MVIINVCFLDYRRCFIDIFPVGNAQKKTVVFQVVERSCDNFVFVSFVDPVIFLSEKGAPNLFYEGFIFHKNGCSRDTTWWKCSWYSKTKCPRRVVTVAGRVVLSMRQKQAGQFHNH